MEIRGGLVEMMEAYREAKKPYKPSKARLAVAAVVSVATIIIAVTIGAVLIQQAGAF